MSTPCSHLLPPYPGRNSWVRTQSVLFLKPRKTDSSSWFIQSKPTRLASIFLLNSVKSVSDKGLVGGGGGGGGGGGLEAVVETSSNEAIVDEDLGKSGWNSEVASPRFSFPHVAKMSLADQAFFLLAFIAFTTSVAFTSLVIAAVPTLRAMGRAAVSFSKLADTARQELPSTMAATRLAGMEISDLILELSDLSQEISDGVNKSAQAVQAAEAGIRQISTIARQQTMSMIEERANLPDISIQPVVTGAAKKTSRAVQKATKTFIDMISRADFRLKSEDNDVLDRVEI